VIVLSAVDRQPLNLTDNVVSVIVEACSTLSSRGERWLDVVRAIHHAQSVFGCALEADLGLFFIVIEGRGADMI